MYDGKTMELCLHKMLYSSRDGAKLKHTTHTPDIMVSKLSAVLKNTLSKGGRTVCYRNSSLWGNIAHIRDMWSGQPAELVGKTNLSLSILKIACDPPRLLVGVAIKYE